MAFQFVSPPGFHDQAISNPSNRMVARFTVEGTEFNRDTSVHSR